MGKRWFSVRLFSPVQRPGLNYSLDQRGIKGWEWPLCSSGSGEDPHSAR